MRPRSTIFDSRSEERLYHRLASRWGSRGGIVAQLPLAKLVELETSDRLTKGELNYFYKTNVDFTFCHANRAVISIEFDGIGGGFSRNGTYVPKRDTEDPHRELKMGFKLRAARQAGYPLLVVSYDETDDLGPDVSLSILDSLIGRYLAKGDFEARFAAGIESIETELEAEPDPDFRQVIVDHVGVDAEVEAAWANDPLVPLAWGELNKYVWSGQKGGHTIQWLWDGDSNDCDRVGAEIKIEIPDRQPVVERVWIRNVGEEIGIYPSSIAETIARYRAFKRANELLGVPTDVRRPWERT